LLYRVLIFRPNDKVYVSATEDMKKIVDELKLVNDGAAKARGNLYTL